LASRVGTYWTRWRIMTVMGNRKSFSIPDRDPVSGGPLVISELACEESGVSIRGRFEIPRYGRLDEEQTKFLDTFLRCRGNITGVERELGVSYPTVRSKLDALLETLDLVPVKEDAAKKEKDADARRSVIDQLERGEISAEEAKAKLRGGVAQ
jgi:hypothetical protein